MIRHNIGHPSVGLHQHSRHSLWHVLIWICIFQARVGCLYTQCRPKSLCRHIDTAYASWFHLWGYNISDTMDTLAKVLKVSRSSTIDMPRLKTCLCHPLHYFGTLFWDDITIFWDDNLLLFTFLNWQTEKKPVLDQVCLPIFITIFCPKML